MDRDRTSGSVSSTAEEHSPKLPLRPLSPDIWRFVEEVEDEDETSSPDLSTQWERPATKWELPSNLALPTEVWYKLTRPKLYLIGERHGEMALPPEFLARMKGLNETSDPIPPTRKQRSLNLALPTEIWREVFSYFRTTIELAHLWTWGRLVSRLWRGTIYDIFASQWLQNTSIGFHFGNHHVLAPAKYEVLPPEEIYDFDDDEIKIREVSFDYIWFEFAGLDPDDPTRALFELYADPDTFGPVVSECMSSDTFPRDYFHYVSIGRRNESTANDTDLPDLVWDPEDLLIGCDWEGMYNNLLGEEHALEREVQRVVEIEEPWVMGLMATGAMSRQKASIAAMEIGGEITTNAFRKVRARRVARRTDALGTEDGDGTLSKSERSAADRVQMVRRGLQNLPTSRDEKIEQEAWGCGESTEEEGENEEGEEDGDDEEEWEDVEEDEEEQGTEAEAEAVQD